MNGIFCIRWALGKIYINKNTQRTHTKLFTEVTAFSDN